MKIYEEVFAVLGLSAFVAYRFLNRSTRPAVSIIFCLPVINGWQFEQISILMSFLVDLVSITLPQTQVIVASLYSG
jgi:hypothetical protein